jgi:KipI family sensor histidine kinase inhibitor
VRLLPAGEHGLLVEVADTPAALALHAQARRHGCPALDIVPGARTVLFDGVDDVAALAAQVTTWMLGFEHQARAEPEQAQPAALADPLEVPTLYDGPDLDEVARRWGMSGEDVASTHSAYTYTVAFCGFLPGFAYCVGLPQRLAVPRRSTPRSAVPAGSVALADAFTGVYPAPSPGGWQLIGHTDLRLWDAAREPPALLSPGTAVRFVAVDR